MEDGILMVNSGIMQTTSSAAGDSIGRSGGAGGLIDIVNECLSDSGQECLDGLASTALVLNLRDVSSSAMLVAALAAVSAAQATQDEEVKPSACNPRRSSQRKAALPSTRHMPVLLGHSLGFWLAQEQVYDLIKQLEGQASVTAALLDSLKSTLSELEQASVKTAVEAETHQQKVLEDTAKVDKYQKQQEHFASRLLALGYDSKVQPCGPIVQLHCAPHTLTSPTASCRPSPHHAYEARSVICFLLYAHFRHVQPWLS